MQCSWYGQSPGDKACTNEAARMAHAPTLPHIQPFPVCEEHWAKLGENGYELVEPEDES